jgi:hypothetical protein
MIFRPPPSPCVHLPLPPRSRARTSAVSIVAFGARGLDEPLLEVHCFYAEHFFVSVHRHPAAAIDSACATLARLHTGRRLVAVYRLLDALVDSMFPFLTAMDDRIEELQDRIFAGPKQSQLAALFEAKRQLVHIGIFGIGTEVLAVAGLLPMSRRRGWMRKAS